MAGYLKRVRISYVLLTFFVTILLLSLVWGGFGKVLPTASSSAWTA